jgi:hypothetical protein
MSSDQLFFSSFESVMYLFCTTYITIISCLHCQVSCLELAAASECSFCWGALACDLWWIASLQLLLFGAVLEHEPLPPPGHVPVGAPGKRLLDSGQIGGACGSWSILCCRLGCSPWPVRTEQCMHYVMSSILWKNNTVTTAVSILL